MSDPTPRPEHGRMAAFKQWFLARLHVFWGNWVSAAGSMLAAGATALMLVFFFVYVYNGLLGRESNPYLDLVAFMVMPAVLLGGVAILLVGNLLRRRRERTAGAEAATAPDETVFVRRAVTVGAVGLLVLAGFGLFSYEAYHYTDSVAFCSYVCHTVMEPEATAYQRSPHANVKCVDCHIGAGAEWYVRAKLSGLRQVYAVLTDSYHTPIPTPVENLRPATETCEVCHWPAKFHGSKIVVREHFRDDAGNTPTVTANVLHVGGPERAGQEAHGIHWHVDEQNQVRYRHLDRERNDIVEIVQSTPDGEVRYLRAGADPDTTQGEWRVMDCLDCHNRPTHIFELPGPAIDEAMASGLLDRDVPWLRSEAEAALLTVVPGEATSDSIAAHLRGVYREEHPDALAALEAVLAPTATTLADILERNVFPAMEVTWGTYGSNLGHSDMDGAMSPVGCFRCHADEHESEDGRTVSQDCEQCHNLLAWDETDWEGLPGLDRAALLQ